MTDADDHDELELLARQLPRDLPPPAEIWPRIAERLAAPSEPPLEVLARRLSVDAPPPAAVWAGVAARIGTPRASRRAAWLGVAALLAALAVWLGVADRTPSGVVTTDARAADAAFEPREPGATLGLAWMLRSAEMSAGVSAGVSADVTAALQRDLAVVQSERLAIERALDRAPDNGDLRELWAHAYEAELELNDIYGKTIMAYRQGSDI